MNMDFPHNEIPATPRLARIDHAGLMAILAAEHTVRLMRDSARQDWARPADTDPMQSRLHLFANRGGQRPKGQIAMQTGAFHPSAASGAGATVNCKVPVYPVGSGSGKGSSISLAACFGSSNEAMGQCRDTTGTAEKNSND